MSSQKGNLYATWNELHGEDYWKNLIDPLDIDLRRTIIHYGELVQATYDSFISDPASKFAGKCHFRPDNLLRRCKVSSASTYKVTKFIYATSTIDYPISFIIQSVAKGDWSRESNWIGYVAVATDVGKSTLGRRDIVVAWRGTQRPMEWINDFEFIPVPATHFLGHGRHGGEEYGHFPHGWMSLYTSQDHTNPFHKLPSARDQVLEELKRLVELYKDEEVSITIVGHSLGAAMSTINALDIVVNGVNVPLSNPHTHFPVTAFVYASPRVGGPKFCKVFNKMPHLRLLHIRNEPDAVPHVPLGYDHVGVELTIDTRKSMFLKSPGDFQTHHNLEAYLHGVAGTHGKHNHFKLVIERDIALVNKSDGALKEEYHVPVSWWVCTNKGMVRGKDGTWRLEDIETGSDVEED